MMSSELLTREPPDSSLYFKSRLSPEDILRRFEEVRRFSIYLTEPLEMEDYVVQSMENASPTKWHLAHTTWFFETFILKDWVRDYESNHPQYDFLFNSYYVQAGDRYPRPRRGLISRPTVREVLAYRADVDARMEELAGASPDHMTQIAGLIEIGLNHEQQHQELILTDLKHMLSANPLFPVYRERESGSKQPFLPKSEWIDFEEGLTELGQDGSTFCYDNEMPKHRVFLAPFSLANRLVTNQEYMEFISDGGYQKQELWLDEGWHQARAGNWEAPLYWREQDGEWSYFTLSGSRPVEGREPVCHVSHFEADAFARWAGARLPTEFEWERAALDQSISGNFVEDGHFHPLPATATGGRLHQLFGDVWEWTQSAYLPYPGYHPLPGALGEYNGKFMSNQMVLRGGSCATSRSHVRATYRNFFQSPSRWQFSGIRLARDLRGSGSAQT